MAQHIPVPPRNQKPKRSPQPSDADGNLEDAPSRGATAADAKQLGTRLLDWYRVHKRDLPWRRRTDPYAIWISEVMLQQTQVKTVTPYYERWLRAFPDVASLARASEPDVLRLWQGLGYYSRARNLQAGARQVLRQGGEFPRSTAELRRLPGVGPYTAGAIASIAFGADEPVVDGNVIRVLTRVFALRGDPRKPALSRRLWELARELLPARRAGDFNQALMELGALCCTPKAPLCAECPLSKSCQAEARGEQLRFPELPKRTPVTPVRRVATLCRRGARVLVAELPPEAPRWAGLWVFPNVEPRGGESDSEAALRALAEFAQLDAREAAALGSLTHSVTRYRITLSSYACHDVRGRARPGPEARALRWADAAELEALPMPSPHRRLARAHCG